MAHKVIVPPKKNNIPQFLKQRDINSYCASSDKWRLFTQPCTIGSWESILGVPKSIKIRALGWVISRTVLAHRGTHLRGGCVSTNQRLIQYSEPFTVFFPTIGDRNQLSGRSTPLCILHGLSYSPSWIMYVIDVLFSSTMTSSEGLCEMLILMKKLIEKETWVDVIFKSFVRKYFMSHLPSLY